MCIQQAAQTLVVDGCGQQTARTTDPQRERDRKLQLHWARDGVDVGLALATGTDSCMVQRWLTGRVPAADLAKPLLMFNEVPLDALSSIEQVPVLVKQQQHGWCSC